MILCFHAQLKVCKVFASFARMWPACPQTLMSNQSNIYGVNYNTDWESIPNIIH